MAAGGCPMPHADPAEAVAEAIGRVRRGLRLRRFVLALDLAQARRDVREILDGRYTLFRHASPPFVTVPLNPIVSMLASSRRANRASVRDLSSRAPSGFADGAPRSGSLQGLVQLNNLDDDHLNRSSMGGARPGRLSTTSLARREAAVPTSKRSARSFTRARIAALEIRAVIIIDRRRLKAAV